MAQPRRNAPERSEIAALDEHAQVAFAVALCIAAAPNAPLPRDESASVTDAVTTLRTVIGAIEGRAQWRNEVTVNDRKRLKQVVGAMGDLSRRVGGASLRGYFPAAVSHTALALFRFLGARMAGESAGRQITDGVMAALQNVEAALDPRSFADAVSVAWNAPEDRSEVVIPDTDADVTLFIDPGDASTEDIRAVLRAINDLHVAAGGLGLLFTVDGTDIRVTEVVPA